MKKLIKIAGIYGLLALISGVVDRTITKGTGFIGNTTLSFTHVHLFALGTLVFLILGLFATQTTLSEEKSFNTFLKIYNIALPFFVIMLYIRGIVEIYGIELSKALNSSISGFAGLSHILIAVAFIFLYKSLINMKSKVRN